VRRVLPSSFPAPPITKRKQQSNPPKLTTHPTQSHPSTQSEKQGKKFPSREWKLLFGCFVAVLVTWMSFAFGARELRGGALSMIETHIVMSCLIFCLALTLVLHLTLCLMLCLVSLMDLTIAHMILVHKRTTLCLDALDTTHILIVVIISRVGLVFLLEGLTLVLS
jgi:flagellar biosynthesis protein FlhB